MGQRCRTGEEVGQLLTKGVEEASSGALAGRIRWAGRQGGVAPVADLPWGGEHF
jgi:hypothetical protein